MSARVCARPPAVGPDDAQPAVPALPAGRLAVLCARAARVFVYARGRAARGLDRARVGAAWLAPLLALALAAAPAAAGPPAGTNIENTAQGSGTDATGTLVMHPVSNTVRAVVQVIESLDLTPYPPLTARPGERVTFAHTLRNTGNAPSDYRLDLANRAGDDFDLDSLSIVHDADRDGVAGPADPVIGSGGTITIAAGDSAALLVSGVLPLTAPGVSEARIQLTATALAQGVTTTVTDVAQTPALGPPPAIAFYANAGYAQTIRRTGLGVPLFVQVAAPQADLRPAAVDTVVIRFDTRLTADQDELLGIETGPHTGTFRVAAALTTAAEPEGGTALIGDGVVTERRGDVVTATIFGWGATQTQASVWVDPISVVFDSHSNTGLAGLRVRLVDVTGAGNGGHPGDLAVVRSADGSADAPADLVTDAQGRYEFPWVAPSLYRLLVDVPAAFRFPSLVPMAELPPDHVLDLGGSYGQPFAVTEDGAPVVMDLPVDALQSVVLFVEKTALRTEAEIGDLVGYQVRVANRSDSAVVALVVRDDPPPGFAYVGGSARLDGVPVADPVRGAGTLTFALGPLAPQATVTLGYRLRLGPGTSLGEALNFAVAEGNGSRSNQAVARVTVRGGVFADEGMILGTVGVDADGDGRLMAGEPGIAGVRLVLDDGSWAMTDGRGRFSFTGVSPRTHALKVDPLTLPARAALIALDHRAGDTPGLRFVDVTRGEMVRADFAAAPDSLLLRELGRAAAAGRGETDRLLARSTNALAPLTPATDPRTLPASRVLTGESSLPLARRDVPAGAGGAAADSGAAGAAGTGAALGAALAAATPTLLVTTPLEQLVPRLDAQLGFIGLADLDTVPASQISVRVKGAAGAGFELYVNGRLLPESRVARRVVAPGSGVEAWEYLGVELEPGLNLLEVAPPGSSGRAALRVVAPGPLAGLALEAPDPGATPGHCPADGVSCAQIVLSLRDAQGLPAGARTLVTLESTLGRVKLADLDPAAAGVQVAVEGGRRLIPLESPTEPGVARITATTGTLRAATTVAFVVESRRPLAVGSFEGVIGRGSFARRGPAANASEARFDAPYRQFSTTSRDGHTTAAARGALYYRGTVSGPWSLTLGYDSDREPEARRFRDLQPDQGYAVVGDASVRGYDAQSSGRLYTRLERPGAWLLYGDYVTNGIGSPAEGGGRALAAYGRSLTGAQTRWEGRAWRVDAFTSRDLTHGRTDELPGLGTSGPYQVASYPFVENSERVEIVVRDRNHPGVVLSVTGSERFTDYEAEPWTGHILFRAPVPSHDEALNPVFVRVTYEVRTAAGAPAGDPFWVYGTTARWRALPGLELAGTVVDDHDPTAERALRGASFRAALAKRTSLEGEWALTQAPHLSAGHGGRIELKHAGTALDARLWGSSTGARFDNPTAGFAGGRDEAGAKLTARLTDRTRLVAEGAFSGDAAGDQRRGGGRLSLDRRLAHGLQSEFGLRVAGGTAPAPGEDPLVAALRARLAWQPPKRPQWTGYAEAEQDVRDGERHMAALGGEYRVAQRGRLYARHELISSLGSAWNLNGAQQRLTTVVGADADVRRDQHVFGEYRMTDALAGRDAQAAVGLRNGWQLARGARLGTSFERVSPLGDASAGGGPTTAGTVALDLTGGRRWKASSRVELRASDASTQFLQTTAGAVQLDDAWTALVRHALSTTHARAASQDEARERVQLGLAWRPGGIWELLARSEFRFDRGASAVDAGTLGGATGTAAADPDARRVAGVVGLNADGRLGDRDVVTLGWAGKLTRERSELGTCSGGGQWLRLRTTSDIARDWDLSWTTSVLTGRSWNQRRWGTGLEVGRQLHGGVWLSLGFNRFGYFDEELAGEEWTREGAFVRLRMKVDETTLERRGAAR